MTSTNTRETRRTRARYQRIAWLYDWMEAFPEMRYQSWRTELWQRVQGQRVLEVGVGTGKNIPFYPLGAEVTAIDLAPGMLAYARRKANTHKARVQLAQGDVQGLDFPDDSFDAAVATFVFCSVPDPVAGFRELVRVVRPGGNIHLLEHVRAGSPWLGLLMDLADPVVVRLMGAHINRRTLDNIRSAGLMVTAVEDLDGIGIFKRIEMFQEASIGS